MRYFLWSYAIANYISFFTWLALPAAPPWYLRAHGCAIDLNTAPSPAGLLRVDEYLGIVTFETFTHGRPPCSARCRRCTAPIR